MKKSFTYLLFFLHTLSISAQENLVPNSSFEEFLTCPSLASPYYFVDRAKYWFMPTTGSSDYFNNCSTELLPAGYPAFSVPQNYAGYQEARTGGAYSMYYCTISENDNDSYYEYISVKLSENLIKNKIYELSYFVSLGDFAFNSAYPLQFHNNSAAFFSKDSLIINNDKRINEQPQVVSSKNILLSDSLGWQKVSGYFIAEGDERYLTIGCFAKFSELEINYVDVNTGLNVVTYYYVDDVSLIETDLVIPNVFSPNEDGKNDLFEIPLDNVDFKIMNRWGNLIFDSKDMSIKVWNGTVNGQKCTEGVYFYVIEGLNIKGFIQLIR